MVSEQKDVVTVSEPAKLQLYNFWRSSCSQRVRIALNLKGIDYDYRAVNLWEGDQFTPEFERLNPLKLVPALVDADAVVADSFAIILYLEEKYPEVPLLPKDLKKKALNLQVANIVASSIQPYHLLFGSKSIDEKISAEENLAWTHSHINRGLTALEKLLKDVAGKYATGDEVLLADIFLAPQIHAGVTRFEIDMSLYPTLAKLKKAYEAHPSFEAAIPERQPDAPPSSQG